MTEWIARCRARLPALNRREKGYLAAGFALCFLFAGSRNAVAPLGMAGAAAFWVAGFGPGGMLGGLLGALAYRSYQQATALLLYGLSAAAARFFNKTVQPQDKLLLLCAAWSATFPFFSFGSLEAMALSMACLALSLLCGVGLCAGLRACGRMERGRCPTDSEQAGLCLLAGCLVYSLGNYGVDGLSASAAAACFFTLLAVYARGILALAAAAVFSAGCLLAGADAALAGCLSLCALCACSVRQAGKWALCAAFFGAALIVCAFLSPALALGESALATALFLCIPRNWLSRLRMEMPDRELQQAQAALSLLRQQLKSTADVLREAAPLFQSEDGFAMRQALAVSDALSSLCQEQRPLRRRFDVRVGAAAIAKAGSRQTGDSMGMREVQGKLLLLLSDGMGTGPEAHAQSAAAVALLGDLLRIGFDLSDALDCVNRMLMQRRTGQREMFVTMDALLFDPADAAARFIKYGAPPSFILREGKVHTLYAEALPAGILKEARPALHLASLRRGDAVVLMTDGAFDALGAELTRTILEQVGGANTADDAARALLMAAREKSGADDITVIVARVS